MSKASKRRKRTRDAEHRRALARARSVDNQTTARIPPDPMRNHFPEVDTQLDQIQDLRRKNDEFRSYRELQRYRNVDFTQTRVRRNIGEFSNSTGYTRLQKDILFDVSTARKAVVCRRRAVRRRVIFALGLSGRYMRGKGVGPKRDKNVKWTQQSYVQCR